MTKTPDEAWVAVGQRIAARIEELAISKAELIRASGVSDKTLAGYLAGKPAKRVDKVRELTAALGWRPDAFDRILRGEEPELLPPPEERVWWDASHREIRVRFGGGHINIAIDHVENLDHALNTSGVPAHLCEEVRRIFDANALPQSERQARIRHNELGEVLRRVKALEDRFDQMESSLAEIAASLRGR